MNKEQIEAIALELAGETCLKSDIFCCYETDKAVSEFAIRLIARIDAERGKEAVAWMWQHDETGRIGFVDQWQIDNGFAAGNPRLNILGPFVRQSDAAAIIAAQSAALAKAKEALEGVCDSDEECQDSDGWTAAVISFEALHEAQEALETIAQLDGAQAEEHAHPASDADNAIYQSIARNYTAQAGEEGKEPRHD